MIVTTAFAIGSAAGTFIVAFGFAAFFLLIIWRCHVYEAADYFMIEM
jgi:hypothetical protein